MQRRDERQGERGPAGPEIEVLAWSADALDASTARIEHGRDEERDNHAGIELPGREEGSHWQDSSTSSGMA